MMAVEGRVRLKVVVSAIRSAGSAPFGSIALVCLISSSTMRLFFGSLLKRPGRWVYDASVVETGLQ